MSNVSEFIHSLWSLPDKLGGLQEPIGLFSSDDGDGLAATYLMTVLLDTLGKDYRVVILDKAYPEIAREMVDVFGSAVFIDIGGPFHVYIPEEMRESVVIIDDHMGVVKPPPEITYFNPYSAGLSEENPLSTSIMVYTALEKVVESPGRYAGAAILGLGEMGARPRGYVSRVIAQGYDKGVIRRERKSVKIRLGGVYREYKSLFRDITLVSMMGYYDDLGFEIIASFRYGGLDELLKKTKEYEEARKKMFNEMFRLMDSGEMVLHKKYIQWIEDYKSIFHGVSPRIFDKYMSTLSRYGRYFDPNKYILGITSRDSYVPGWGALGERWLNIPIRATKKVETLIGLKRKQPINALAEASAYRVKGLGYGYPTQGSAVIPQERVKEFLDFFNELAGEEY